MNLEPEPGTDTMLPSSADELAFVDFYRRHHEALTRTAAALVGRQDVAEELTHDAFIGLARRWDEVDSPYGYVRRSVVNGAYDHLRKRRRRRILTASQRPEPAPTPPEIDETLGQLGGLSPKRQTALVLRFYEDLDYDEIAETMDCKPATARSLVHRGLKQMRRKLT